MRRRFRHSLFGLDPRAVREALEQTEQQQEEEIKSLEASLQAELSEQEQLRQRIQWTEERLRHQQTLILQMEESRRQAEMAAPLMLELVQRQVRDMAAAAERERQALSQQLSRLNERINESRRKILHWLDQVVEVAAAAEGNTAVAEQPPGAPAEGTAEQAPVRVLPLRSAPSREEPEEAMPEAVAEAPRAGTLLTLHPQSGVRSGRAWRPGTIGAGAPSTPAPPESAPVETPPGSPAAAPHQDEPAPAAAAAPQQDEPAPAAAAAPQQGEPAAAAAAAAAASVREVAAAHEDVVASGLSARIGVRMMRFLQGKVVGQDLYAPDGEVIARKGARISPELAEKAQQAGVMPELILHMTWPEES